MSSLVDLIVSGLATGAIYALAAIGFTLLWQTSQTINFAQGEFVMLPAFLMLAAMRVGAPFWLAIVVGLALSLALLGLAFKRILVDPMLRHGVLPLAIATMALSTAMKESVKTFYSAEAQPFPSIAPSGSLSIFGASVSLQSVGVFAFGVAAVVALSLFLDRTSTGRQMQAAAQNPTVARIVGIPVERMATADLRYQRRPGGARFALGDADLPRQILLRRHPRPSRLRRRNYRRLQSGARRNRRRIADRRRRQSRRRIRFDPVSGGGSIGADDRRHPFPAARTGGAGRGTLGMTRGQRLLAAARAAAVLAGLIVAPLSLGRYGLYVLSLWAVMSIAAIGLNLTLGYAGQVSLAQGAFVGVGAYAAAILTTHGYPLGCRDGCGAGALLRHWLAARLSRAARSASLSRLRHPRFLDLGVSGLPQRGMVDRRHLWHQRRAEAEPVRPLRGQAAAVLLPLPVRARCRDDRLLGVGSLALGPRLHGAARESAARRLARRRHAPLHADGFRHRLGARRPRRARSMRRSPSSSTRRRSRSRCRSTS